MGAKTSLLLLALLCLALGIARSDHSLPVATGARDVIEINFWNGFTGPDGRVMLELVRSFNEQNASDAHVSMQRIAWATYYNKLMVSALNARGPEVFVLQAQLLARMDRAGIVDAVDDLFADRALLADFDEAVLRRVNFGTAEKPRRIGLPLDIWPQGLYCNADMLKAIGFTNPDGTARAPRTRDEFLQAAAAMKHDDQWGFGFGAWNNNFMTLVPQFAGQYVDENGEPTLDHPGNIEALQFLVDLLQKYHVAPNPEGGVAGWVGFRQQRVGMVFDGIYMLGDLKRLEGHPYFGAPMPQLGARPGTLADSHVLCVRKGLDERHRRAAEQFIRYISDHSLAWADAGQIPARRSVRDSDAFKKLQVQNAFAQQLPYVMYPPNTPSLSELQLRINLAVEKAIRGRASAADALHEAQADYQRYLQRDRMERQFASQAEGRAMSAIMEAPPQLPTARPPLAASQRLSARRDPPTRNPQPRASFRRHAPGYLFLVPYGIAFAMFIVLPFVVSLVLAFCQYDLAAQRPPKFVGLRNFNEALFHDPFFWQAVFVTFRYVAWIIPAQIILSVLLALGMNAMTLGRNTVCAMLFLPGMFSIAVTAILWQWFYNQEFGLFNYLLAKVRIPGVPWLSSSNIAMLSIVLMSLWWTVGGSAAVILTGLQQIPRQIIEAAAIDGANPWQSFWQITLPMLKPVLLFMVVMNTIGAFQMFAQSMLLTNGGPEMTTRGVVSLIYDTAFGDYRLGYGAAISWLLFLIIAAFSLIQYRLIRRGAAE